MATLQAFPEAMKRWTRFVWRGDDDGVVEEVAGVW
jgi:hypothetical protein